MGKERKKEEERKKQHAETIKVVMPEASNHTM
jgi:hypothetical protein